MPGFKPTAIMTESLDLDRFRPRAFVEKLEAPGVTRDERGRFALAG